MILEPVRNEISFSLNQVWGWFKWEVSNHPFLSVAVILIPLIIWRILSPRITAR